MNNICLRRFLILSGTIGMSSFAGCQESTPSQEGTPADDSDTLGLTLSKSGPGRLADSGEVHSGWVHVVAHGQTYDVTFDARICHGHQDEVEVDLTDGMSDVYALEFSTNGEIDDDSECNYGTRIVGSSTIPTDFDSLRIKVNGRTIQTVEKESTTAILRPLPDPIES